jgi:transposase
VATELNRAREAGLNCWPLPKGRDDDTMLKQVLFQQVGRPPRDLTEPDWPKMAVEMKAKAHQRHSGMTAESLITRAARTGYHTAALVERLMRDRPHPEQGYRSALGVLSLQRQFGADRLEAACDRALTVGTVSYASVRSILVTGLDQAPEPPEPITATPAHDNIRGSGYYQ